MQETQVRFLGREDPLEKEMASHSSIFAWKSPMDRGAWQATVREVLRVRHELATKSPPQTWYLIANSIRKINTVKMELILLFPHLTDLHHHPLYSPAQEASNCFLFHGIWCSPQENQEQHDVSMDSLVPTCCQPFQQGPSLSSACTWTLPHMRHIQGWVLAWSKADAGAPVSILGLDAQVEFYNRSEEHTSELQSR